MVGLCVVGEVGQVGFGVDVFSVVDLCVVGEVGQVSFGVVVFSVVGKVKCDKSIGLDISKEDNSSAVTPDLIL